MYSVARVGLPEVVLFYSTAYSFGEAEYELRPSEVVRGSFILILPHADFAGDIVERARGDGVGIGHLAKFMGALNYQNVWEYFAPNERRRP